MKITYDAEADAAYIQMVDKIGPGESAAQVHSIATPGDKGEITIDFDSQGRVLGFEILWASAVLREEVLAQAVPPTPPA